jgi:hypothetical protein
VKDVVAIWIKAGKLKCPKSVTLMRGNLRHLVTWLVSAVESGVQLHRKTLWAEIEAGFISYLNYLHQKCLAQRRRLTAFRNFVGRVPVLGMAVIL